MFTRLRLSVMLAEFLGTATLVMVAIVLSQITPVSYFLGTSLALALAALVVIFGAISGAHLNPALTFAMWTARRIGTLRATGYVVAQMLGGLAAWQLFQYLADKDLPARTVEFTTQAWLAEAVGTFILALGITAVVARAADSLQWAFAAGASYFVGIIAASTAAAGFLNPAMALGMRSWNAAYVLGPLVGALLAVNLYYLLFAAPAAVTRKKTATRRR